MNALHPIGSELLTQGFNRINYSALTIPTLFAFRYLLDQPDDIVNLQADIEDLEYFPERLRASYQDEWITYIKKAIRKMHLTQLSQAELSSFSQNRKDENVQDENVQDENVQNNLSRNSLLPENEHIIRLKRRFKSIQTDKTAMLLLSQVRKVDRILSSSDISYLKSEKQRQIEKLIK